MSETEGFIGRSGFRTPQLAPDKQTNLVNDKSFRGNNSLYFFPWFTIHMQLKPIRAYRIFNEKLLLEVIPSQHRRTVCRDPLELD